MIVRIYSLVYKLNPSTLNALTLNFKLKLIEVKKYRERVGKKMFCNRLTFSAAFKYYGACLSSSPPFKCSQIITLF